MEAELLKQSDFAITLNGRVMDNRADEGNLIIREVSELKLMEEKVIGEYRGFELAMLKDTLGGKKIVLKGASDYDTEISTSPVGLIVRLENLFEGILERKKFFEKKISDYERDMKSSKEQYEKPFEYEEELNQKIARQSELNNMLDLENGKAMDEDLGSLIEEVLTDLEPLAQEKKVELIQKSQEVREKADEVLFLTGSDILIYRMLYNLVENAIKYNRKDGTVMVSALREKNKVVLTVSDTGNGIDEAFREQIFEPFFRVDKSRSRELGGVGLGLAMVREVVRVHDGTIEVYTNKHSGTTFEVKMGIGTDFEKAV